MKGGDIPKELLIEILCRLPSAESACQCKLVSRSWCALISDPYFIGRFLWIQRKRQTPVLGTLINEHGNALLLDTELVFTRRMKSFFDLMERPRVVARWNDLVVCCKEKYPYYNYYIGNPQTMQLVSLPPTVRYHPPTSRWWYREPAVGFICEPYYDEKQDITVVTESDQEQPDESKIIKTNVGYKFKVVRILPPDEPDVRCFEPCFEFNIQVFSSETGEWRESLVSCRQGFIFSQLFGARLIGVATNGMLYWNASSGDILGLGPLMINDKSSTTTANGDNSSYQFHVIEFHQFELCDYVRRMHEPFTSPFRLALHRGRLLLVMYNGARLWIWELNKQELEQMAVQGGGKLGREHRMLTCNLQDQELREGAMMNCIAFHPNELDTCYVHIVHPEQYKFYKCNIRTGKHSIIGTPSAPINIFPLRHTWWPTPVPIISGN